MTEGHTERGPSGRPSQPGIVPLRALDAGDIIGGAARSVRRHPTVVLVPSLVAALAIGAGQVAVQFSGATAPRPGAGFGEAFVDSFVGSLVVSIPFVFLYIAVFPPVLGTVFSGLHPAVLGRRPTLGGVWAAARRRLRTLYGLQIVLTGIGLVPIAVLLGVVLPIGRAGGVATVVAVSAGLVIYVAQIYVCVLLCMAMPAATVEGFGVRDALWRSVELVRGAWWRVFGVQLLAGLIVFGIGMVVTVPLVLAGFALASAGSLAGMITMFVVLGLGGVLVTTAGFGLTVGVLGLLHQDQRVRRERHDLDLIREAGAG